MSEKLVCGICGHDIPRGVYHTRSDGTALHDVCSYRETIENLMARIAELEAAAAPKPACEAEVLCSICDAPADKFTLLCSQCGGAGVEGELAPKPAPACEAPNWITVAERLEADSLAWDDKNDDRPLPTAQGSTDYVYGYNAGVSEGFRAASVRMRALAASVPPPPKERA